jgi:HK97 family phage major capsid protein
MPATMEVSKTAEISKLQGLEKRQAELYDRAKEIEASAAEAGGMTEEQEAEFHACLDEIDALEKEHNDRLAADEASARKALLAETETRLMRQPKARTALTSGSLGRVTHMRDRILDSPTRGFANFGEFASLVAEAFIPGRQVTDERLLKIGAAATGLNQAQGSQGGYLVPMQFSQMIWDGMNEMPDNLMQYCDVYQVTGESLTFNANAETSRVTGSRYGGIRAYWIAEAAQKTASMPRFRQMKLEPQELAVLVYATDKLLRNAPALEAYLRKAATEEIMWLVNDAIINGTGAGQPLGIMNSPALITVAAEAGQAADTVELENINKMYARLLSRARGGAAWYINQDVEVELEGLNAAAGTGGFPVYLPSPSGFPTITEAPNTRLKGRPVRPVEYMKTLGDAGDILLANLQYYALGVQGGIQEAMSIHLRFDYNETAFRFVFAIDGQPWIASPLTPANGTNTLSPFVTLAAR